MGARAPTLPRAGARSEPPSQLFVSSCSSILGRNGGRNVTHGSRPNANAFMNHGFDYWSGDLVLRAAHCRRPSSGTPGQWCPIVNRDAIPALPAAGLLIHSLGSVCDGFGTRFDLLGHQFHSYRFGNTLLNIPLLLGFKKWPVCTQVHIVQCLIWRYHGCLRWNI